MTQDFLDSLKRKSKAEAIEACEQAKLTPYPISTDEAMTLEARPSTVILWIDKDDRVFVASPGDPFEITYE